MTSEPDQIRGDIQQTQRELSADVDALTEKLSPRGSYNGGRGVPARQ
jgi:hypothetical protein